MKFTKAELKVILDRTAPFTGRKTPLNITKMVVFKSPDLVYATDLETSYQGYIKPVELNESEINGSWEWAIPAKQLAEIIREMPGDEIEIIEDDSRWFLIKGSDGKASFHIAGLDPAEFPAIEQPPHDLEWVEFKPADFAYQIQKLCSLDIMADDKRAHIKGILFQGSNMVSTNIANLIIFDTEKETDFNSIVPKQAISAVAAKMPMDNGAGSVAFSDGNCYIKVDEEIFSIRCLEGDFPAFQSALDRIGDDVKIKFEDAAAFKQALKQSAIMTSDGYKSCVLDMDVGNNGDNTITITTTNPDVGEGKVDLDLSECEFDLKESVTVAFNPVNFSGLISEFKSVSVQGSGDKMPYLVTGEWPNLKCVIMPMKI